MTNAPATPEEAGASNVSQSAAGLAPVFVHSGYRTSSTWFWSKFRQNPRACAYYEPFNPHLADLTGASLTSIRGGMWRSHHPLSAPYMTEYGILLGGEPGVPLFPRGDQDGERFIGDAGIEGPLDADVKVYVENLIAVSQGLGRVPVLACTRTLGRVAGFRKALRGHHILLVRNLFHQWCSYSGQLRFGNDYFFATLFQSLRAGEKNEYLAYLANFFSEAERADFLAWSRIENHDRIYCYFVALQAYLLMTARRHVHLVVDANRLARSGPEHRTAVADQVTRLTGLEIDLDDARESVDFPFEQIRSVDDCRMLLQTMLDRLFPGEAPDDEDRSFVEGLIGDLWEEQGRFSTMTAGATEVIQLSTAEATAERERRREAEEREAEESTRLAALSEELTALKAQHGNDAKAHTEQLATALETTSELAKQLDQAEQALIKVLAETINIEVHTAQMAEAREIRRDLERKLDQATADLAGSRDKTDRALRLAEAERAELDRLQAHIAWREKQLQDADNLLASTPDKLSGKSGFAKLVGRLVVGRRQVQYAAEYAASVARWKAGVLIPQVPEAPLPDHSSIGDSPTNAIAPLMHKGFDFMHGDSPITTVPRLLEPNDRQFIHAAYQAVLGRAPDQGGEAYYLSRLRGGAHKLEILRHLRRSPEGRAFIPGVAGLDRAIKRHRWATRPGVGILVRLLTGAEGNSATHRQIRTLGNDLGRLAAEQAVLIRAVQDLASRPITVVQTASTAMPTSPPSGPGHPAPPSMETGEMSKSLDSGERRLVRNLRLFARTKGAPA